MSSAENYVTRVEFDEAMGRLENKFDTRLEGLNNKIYLQSQQNQIQFQTMMDILRNMQTSQAGNGAGQKFQESNTTSIEGLGASELPRSDSGVENLDGGASNEIYLDPSLLTEELPVVVTLLEQHEQTNTISVPLETREIDIVSGMTKTGDDRSTCDPEYGLSVLEFPVLVVPANHMPTVAVCAWNSAVPSLLGIRQYKIRQGRRKRQSKRFGRSLNSFDSWVPILVFLIVILRLLELLYAWRVFYEQTRCIGKDSRGGFQSHARFYQSMRRLSMAMASVSAFDEEKIMEFALWISLLRIWDPGGCKLVGCLIALTFFGTLHMFGLEGIYCLSSACAIML